MLLLLWTDDDMPAGRPPGRMTTFGPSSTPPVDTDDDEVLVAYVTAWFPLLR